MKLERLRSFRGAQTYRLPPGMEPADFHTVTIWCESFSMYIGSGAIVATSAAEEGRARAA